MARGRARKLREEKRKREEEKKKEEEEEEKKAAGEGTQEDAKEGAADANNKSSEVGDASSAFQTLLFKVQTFQFCSTVQASTIKMSAKSFFFFSK